MNIFKNLTKQKEKKLKDLNYSPSLDELAESQNVKPLTNVDNIFGKWPGDIDDGFEKLIKE